MLWAWREAQPPWKGYMQTALGGGIFVTANILTIFLTWTDVCFAVLLCVLPWTVIDLNILTDSTVYEEMQ